MAIKTLEKKKKRYFAECPCCSFSHTEIHTAKLQKLQKKHHKGTIKVSQLGLYDFRNAENADGIAESSHKNGIYSLTRKVTEFVKVWIN